MRLLGGTDYLVLRRSNGLLTHTVHVYQSFPDALGAWTAGTRISPIFPLDGAELPPLTDESVCWMLFAGPIHPEKVDHAAPTLKFLTLGLFNLLLVSLDPEEAERARQHVGMLGVCWEEWHVVGNRVEGKRYSDRISAAEPIPKSVRQPFKGAADAFNEALREYSVMMATSVGRAAMFCPSLVPDLVRFDTIFRSAYADDRGNAVVKQGMLVQVNAALSRLSSQTFSGTSPIIETECHFWTHSLLGIGTASLALVTIRRHLERVLVESRLIDLVLALKHVAPAQKQLTELAATDDFWRPVHLAEALPHLEELTPEQRDAEIPLVTFFSGRDGFHSTHWSLSGPLELITSCNTTAWTMLTLTHEFSHSIIERILGQLLPAPNNEKELARITNVLKTGKAGNLLDQARAFLCFAMWSVTASLEEAKLTPAALKSAIISQYGELDEILTHLIDFTFFYQGKEEAYIRSIWVSWGVIPNIERRVTEYVIRSLCVLYLADYRRKNGAASALERLSHILKNSHVSFPAALYIPEALRQLDKEQEFFLTEIRKRLPYVKFAATFLQSPDVVAAFDREAPAAGGEKRKHSAELHFDTNRVADPIAFLKTFSDETAANAAKSLWMIQQLAFAEEA